CPLRASLVAFAAQGCGVHRRLQSFPTRRSSDLGGWATCGGRSPDSRLERRISCLPGAPMGSASGALGEDLPLTVAGAATELTRRSEEHTSELQSRENLVCRLLLEKKKDDTGNGT